MILLVTGNFPIADRYGIPTGKYEYITSHGIDVDTGANICLPQEHPKQLGAKQIMYDGIVQWILPD